MDFSRLTKSRNSNESNKYDAFIAFFWIHIPERNKRKDSTPKISNIGLKDNLWESRFV